MTIHEKATATAQRLLTKFGQSVALQSVTVGVYDPATGAVSSAASTQNGVGVELAYRAAEIDGTNVQRGDRKLLISSVGITAPKPEDKCTVAGVVYTVKSVEPITPGGVNIAFYLQLRA